jgi:hypothetical protein
MDANNWYAVGASGLILKTTNGGNSTSVGQFQQNKSENAILYPNPSSTNLYISNATQNAIAFIYDLQGRLLINRQIIDNQIDIENLQKGLYVIKISDNNILSSGKFLKE